MSERLPRKSSVFPSLLLGGCVVTLVLVPLLGLVPPILFNLSQPRSRQGADRTNVGAFASAIRLYMLDHGGRTPPTLSALITGDKAYLSDVKEIPRDRWGRAYHYQAPGPADEPFRVTCWGADGRPGGTGDDADITSSEQP